MGMVPERSKLLHNFSFPCLKWGSQKFLRCVNDDPLPPQPSPSSLDRRSSRPQPKSHLIKTPKRKQSNNVDGVAGKKLKASTFEDGIGGEEGNGGAAANRPWNLRTRRAACKEPPSQSQLQQKLPHDDEGCKVFEVGSSSSLQVKGDGKKKMMMMNNERVRFSVSLSKQEVEQDFWGLVGSRPPRRPKKRPRIVQRQLDTLFPGLWLTEVTAEAYKVSDVPE